MKKFLVLLVSAGLVAVGVVLVADKLGSNTSNEREAAPPANGGEGEPAPSAIQPTQSAAEVDSGSITVTMRGTSGTLDVTCGDIHTEFIVAPYGGSISWTAHAWDHDPNVPGHTGSIVPGIQIVPAAGVLSAEQTQLIQVSGSFAGADGRFWIKVENRAGNVVHEYTCV